jgi:cold shock CspA family protein
LTPAVHTGEVTEFDEARGLGTLRDAGGELLAFHCTEIAGGSRTIAVGARVAYLRRPARGGTVEAVSLVEVG